MKRLLTSARFYGKDNTVTVIVGSSASVFTVHRDLFTASSRQARIYFVDHLCMEPNMRLPSASEVDFNAYLNWLYHQVLPIECEEVSPKTPSPSQDPEYFTLTRLYMLGTELEDVGFQNAVINAFVAKLEEPRHARFNPLPGPLVIGCIYNLYGSTLMEHKLRDLVVDAYAKKATTSDVDTLLPFRPMHKFLTELTRRLVWAKVGSSLPELEARNYHTAIAEEEGAGAKKRKLKQGSTVG